MVERYNDHIAECAARLTLPILRSAGGHAAPLCLAPQLTIPEFNLGKQVALAGYEGLVQTQTGDVQEAAILSSGM